MTTDRIAAALSELEAERSSVVAEILELERRREDRLTQLKRLDGAIGSLNDLFSGTGDGDAEIAEGPPDVVPPLPKVPPGPGRFLPYLSHSKSEGGTGLQSAHMVAAVVDDIAEPVSRDKLQKAFFDYFGKEQLETYWRQPIKAFRSALARAVERDIISEVEYPDGGGVVYIGGWRLSDPDARGGGEHAPDDESLGGMMPEMT